MSTHSLETKSEPAAKRHCNSPATPAHYSDYEDGQIVATEDKTAATSTADVSPSSIKSISRTKKNKKPKKKSSNRRVDLDRGVLSLLSAVRTSLNSTGLFGSSSRQVKSFVVVRVSPVTINVKPPVWQGARYYVTCTVTDHSLAPQQLGVSLTFRTSTEGNAKMLSDTLTTLTANYKPFLLATPPFAGNKCEAGFLFEGILADSLHKAVYAGNMTSASQLYNDFTAWHDDFKSTSPEEASAFMNVFPRNGYNCRVSALTSLVQLEKLLQGNEKNKSASWKHVRIVAKLKQFHPSTNKPLLRTVCGRAGHWGPACSCDPSQILPSLDAGVEMTIQVGKTEKRFTFFNDTALITAIRLSRSYLLACTDSELQSAVCMERTTALAGTDIEVTLIVNPRLKASNLYAAKIVAVYWRTTPPRCQTSIDPATLEYAQSSFQASSSSSSSSSGSSAVAAGMSVFMSDSDSDSE